MRLPNKFGSVYKLSGTRRNPWVARITVGYKTIEESKTVRPIYKYIGYYPTKAEALSALTLYNENPFDLNARHITLKDVYDKWSREHFESISWSNVQSVMAAWKLCKNIENMRIADIKLDHLQLIADNSGKNTPTLKKLKIMLGQMYDYAVIHEYIPVEKREMVRYLDISKPGNPNSYNREPFSLDEIEKVWNSLEGNIYYSVVLILIYTGTRIGELLSLKKEDIHLDERWFYIQASKTEAGIREVPIAEKIVPLFKYWMNRDCEYLICTPDNEPFLYRNYYDSYWKPLMDSLDMQHRPHDTRHTCISLLAMAGVDDRVIKRIVGHKGQGVTETVYTHLFLPIKLEAINKI